jgi:hypothetical protein
MPAVRTRLITVAETHSFTRLAAKIWSEEERAELIDYIAHNPEAGSVIPGTGGVRKLRWGAAGSGKRGGARVVYFYYRSDTPLYLLLAYAKAQASDLTADEKKAVSALATAFKAAADKGERR